MHSLARAVALMVSGCALLTCNDAVMKALTESIPLGEAVFIRSVFCIVPITILIVRADGFATLRVHRWGGQLLRAGLLAFSTVCFLSSLAYLPLAEATSLAYASPIILTVLAPWLLGEKVSAREWVAVVMGFTGVLIMLEPNGGELRVHVLLPLGAAVSEALRDVVTRRLTATETSESMMAMSVAVVGLLALTTVGGWRVPTGLELGWLAVAGLFLGLAHFMTTDAFRYAAAVVVAPFRYTGVVWALLLGVLVFGETPGPQAMVGAAFVVGSGWYVLRVSLARQAEP
jgi:drug/metabolite transporter (DMT)-like permease